MGYGLSVIYSPKTQFPIPNSQYQIPKTHHRKPITPKKKGNNYRHSPLYFDLDIDYPNAKRMNPVAVKSLSVDFMY